MTVRSLVNKDTTSAVLWQFRACAAFSLTFTERNLAGGGYADMLDNLGRNSNSIQDYDKQSNASVAARSATLSTPSTAAHSGMHTQPRAPCPHGSCSAS